MSDEWRQDRWRAFARETASAAEHLAVGATALGNANHAEHAHYSQAFFALSTGCERAAKLILILDLALDHGGRFPATEEIRQHGHDVQKLLKLADGVAERRNLSERLPDSRIHDSIIQTLSAFAQNRNRYYNIDLITGLPNIGDRDEPVARWHSDVTAAVLSAHLKPRQRMRMERAAKTVDALVSEVSLVRHQSETGELLDSGYKASLHVALTDYAKPFVRMYVLQIARFLASGLSELGDLSQGLGVPYLRDFVRLFLIEDRFFRSQKKWSIYRL